MKTGKVLSIAAACLLGVSVYALADDASATQPSGSDQKAVAPAKPSKIIAPFNALTDLTDDQKSQIKAIQKDEKAQEKELRSKEHDDIMALLTDDQKKELADASAKDSLEKKADSAEKRADAEQAKAKELRDQAGNSSTPATQPSGGSN